MWLPPRSASASVCSVSSAHPTCTSFQDVIAGGGVGDGAIDGEINVAVIDNVTEAPISGATVDVGERCSGGQQELLRRRRGVRLDGELANRCAHRGRRDPRSRSSRHARDEQGRGDPDSRLDRVARRGHAGERDLAARPQADGLCRDRDLPIHRRDGSRWPGATRRGPSSWK